jgi:ubiquinone/menaquinone biosynthesis C-methylase UbiE
MLMLDLGCGLSKHKGCLGVDVRRLRGVDIVADASRLPFKDDCFHKVFLRHIVEHVSDIVAFMKEIWRVTENGATVSVWTPHFTAYHSYRDPTHLHHFTIESFDYFDGTTALGKEFRFSNEFEFRIRERRIMFTKRIFWNYLIEYLANKYSMIYERILGWPFSADHLYFELEAVKTSQRKNKQGKLDFVAPR